MALIRKTASIRVVISGYVITQLQTVISRENYPVYPGVLTIGSIHGGTVNNIIPDYVEMHGTRRSLDPDCRKKMMAAIDRVVKGCAESMRGTAGGRMGNRSLRS